MVFFERTDVFHLKQQVLAIRPEGVLLLRPSSIRFINDAVKNQELGLKGKKEFLVAKADEGKEVTL